MKIGSLLPKFILFLTLLVSVAAARHTPRVYADDSCTAIIPLLIKATSEGVCREINRNWACYGQRAVDISPTGLRFAKPADRAPIVNFEDIDPRLQEGMVLLRVQATTQQAPLNLLVLGDQGVKSLGDAAFEAAAQSTKPLCSDTPSGIVVQTDEGLQGTIKINQVEIILGSTAFVMVDPADQMTVVNIEGRVAVAIAGGPPQAIPEGQQMRILASSNPTGIIGPEPTDVDQSPVLQFIANDPRGLRRLGDPNTGDPSWEAQVPPCGGTIKFGETLTQQTFTLGQECLFTFIVDLNNVATINLESIDDGSGNRLDPWVDLRGPNLELLASNNDIARDELNSRICNFPLPSRTGVYTIVARAAGNQSKGRFDLTLDDQADCSPPEPRCTILVPALNLRSGPGVTYPVLKTVTQDARLRPVGRDPADTWFYVEDLADGLQGWVSAGPSYLTCEEGFTLPVTVTPPPVTPSGGTVTPPVVSPTPETPGPPPNCTPTAWQKRYHLPAGDCPPPPPTVETPPPERPTDTVTPVPKPAPKDPPAPGP